MEIKRQSVAFNILRNFKEVIEVDPFVRATEILNDNFNKGLIDELIVEQAFEQLDNLLEKGHKYYKREGTPGNYKYYYTEEQYNKAKGKRTEDKESKSSEKSKDSPESFNAVREWAGDNLKDEYIHSIIDSLKEDGIKDQNLKPKKTWSQEGQENAILEKVKELKQSHRDGLEHKDMSSSDIEDVLWGMVKASMDGYKFFD